MNTRKLGVVLLLSLLVVAQPAVAQTDSPTPTATDNGTATPADDVDADEPQGIFEISENFYAFIAGIVGAYVLVGLWSKSLAIAAWGGSLSFYYLAFETDKMLFENIALATLVLAFLGMAFKLVRLEFEGES